MENENKRVVMYPDTKVFVKRIFEILDLHKKWNPEKYGDLNTDLTKSYISRKSITVTMQDGSFDNPYCEFPTEWLKLSDSEIIIKILNKKQ